MEPMRQGNLGSFILLIPRDQLFEFLDLAIHLPRFRSLHAPLLLHANRLLIDVDIHMRVGSCEDALNR